MATFAFELSKYKDRKGQQAIILRILAGNSISRKSTGFKIEERQWDEGKERVKRTHPLYTKINDALDVLMEGAEAAHADIVAEGVKITHADQIAAHAGAITDFYELAREKIAEFEKNEQWGTKRRYETVINKLKEFAPKLDASAITEKFLKQYHNHLESLDNEPSTIHANMSAIRSVYNYGVDKKYYKGREGLFVEDVMDIPDSEQKESLTLKEVDTLHDTILTGKTALARDMFLCSYYAMGMRWADVFVLRRDAISDGRLTYMPRKPMKKKGQKARSKKILSMRVNDRLKAILDRYAGMTDTVFGFELKKTEKELQKQINSQNTVINKYLQIAINKASIPKVITFHCARQTWATIADKVSKGKVELIQRSMAHSDRKTTEGYINTDLYQNDELAAMVYGG